MPLALLTHTVWFILLLIIINLISCINSCVFVFKHLVLFCMLISYTCNAYLLVNNKIIIIKKRIRKNLSLTIEMWYWYDNSHTIMCSSTTEQCLSFISVNLRFSRKTLQHYMHSNSHKYLTILHYRIEMVSWFVS